MVRHIAPVMIRDIMTIRPRAVTPRTSVRTLQHLFLSYGFNAFPVVDEAHALLGMSPSSISCASSVMARNVFAPS